MESDFINIVNELMREREPDLTIRLEWQEEALDELHCTNPTLGRWFEDNTVGYVLAAFNLSDKDFASAFPGLKQLSTAQRREIVQTFEKHIDDCPRCSRKRSYDLEFEARLEATLNDNRQDLLNALNGDERKKPAEEKQVIDGKGRFVH